MAMGTSPWSGFGNAYFGALDDEWFAFRSEDVIPPTGPYTMELKFDTTGILNDDPDLGQDIFLSTDNGAFSLALYQNDGGVGDDLLLTFNSNLGLEYEAPLAPGPHDFALQYDEDLDETQVWLDGSLVVSLAGRQGAPYLGGIFFSAQVQMSGIDPPSISNAFLGSIDELRFSSIARYASPGPYTPSDAPFEVDDDTIALFHLDEDAIVDHTPVNEVTGETPPPDVPTDISLARLHAVPTLTTDQPARPGGSIGVTMRLLGDDALIYTHTDPLAHVIAPDGYDLAGFEAGTAMTYNSNTGISSLGIPIPDDALEGLYLIELSCSKTIDSEEATYTATIKCRVNVRGTVP